MSDYSLLAYLGPRLIVQVENLASEALWYLLAVYDTANTALVSILSELGIRTEGPLTFDTQIGIPERAIPDLIGRDDQGTALILVEAKFGARLTPNQPVGYIRQLPTDKQGMVVFLIPAPRARDLWGQITQRAEEAGFPTSEPMGDAQEVASVRVTASGRLGFVTWEYLLNRIEERLVDGQEEQALGELWQLQGLVRRLEVDADQAIQDGMPVSAVESHAMKLRQFVDGLVNELVASGQFDIRGYRATPGPGYYRRYGTVQGQINWFVEYNENNARRIAGSLLWLGCPHSTDVEKRILPLFDDSEFTPQHHEGLILFPLSASSKIGELGNTDALEQIDRVIGLLRGDTE